MTRSGRSARSNTCRLSTPIADCGPSGEPQWRQAHGPCAQSRNPDCRLVATYSPCGPSDRRSPCPTLRAGCQRGDASSSTRRSKGAWNCSNCPAPIAGEGPPLQPEAPRSGISAKRSIPRLRQEEPCLRRFRFAARRLERSTEQTPFQSAVTFPTYPALGVTKLRKSAVKPLKSLVRVNLCAGRRRGRTENLARLWYRLARGRVKRPFRPQM